LKRPLRENRRDIDPRARAIETCIRAATFLLTRDISSRSDYRFERVL
jgi:hypothetical protein